MPESNHDRIRRTWAQAAAISGETSTVFYSNLFRLDATTKPLFVGDLDLQGQKLINTLGFIVDNLDEPATLLPAAQDLAVRHVGYGVSADQYASVGAALIKTLDQLLGDAFTEEDKVAWTDTYADLSKTMIDAAYGA